jgi:hypothetical protein
MFNDVKDAQIILKQLPLTDVFRRIPPHSVNVGITKRIAKEHRITLRRLPANDWACGIAYWILARPRLRPARGIG